MKRLTLVLAAMVLACSTVFADQITLKNGDRLTGDIIKSDGKALVIKSEFAGEVTVQWAAVDTISSTQTLHLALKDGQTIVGTATSDSFGVTGAEAVHASYRKRNAIGGTLPCHRMDSPPV